MKICIVLGTRPEIVKMSPVIRECDKKGVDYFIIHTGQHYSKELDEKIFSDLELPKPKYNLGVGGEPYRKQVGLMIKEIIEVLQKEEPNIVLVQGDTISVLAGAAAANRLGIKVAHHEAGLRSHDTAMLEEINRVITDHMSDYLFVPTPDALKNLHQEGSNPEKIFFTGNTIVDAVYQNVELAKNKVNILDNLKVKENEYFLITAHRAENVDNEKRLRGIIKGLVLIQKEFNIPIIYPIHPRTSLRIKEFNIEIPQEIRLINPVGFLEFLQLEQNTKLVLTDSGGAQEEAFILKVPCVTLRDNTERPETLEYGVNILAGTNPEKILEATKTMLNKELNWSKWDNPFGDGKAAERIIEKLIESQNKRN